MLRSRPDGALEEEAARLRGAWACAVLVLLGGCSASTATMECRRAERLLQSASISAFASARTYDLTLARAYLDKAREEASEAHYGSAIDLAGASQRASRRAGAPEGTKGRD